MCEAFYDLLREKGFEMAVEYMLKKNVFSYFDPEDKKKRKKDSLDILLDNYLKRFARQYLYISTLVFRRMPMLIEDLYYPLTIVGVQAILERSPRERHKIDEQSTMLLQSRPRYCIMDNAGMGKSTLVQYHALQNWMTGRYIPIIVQLRKVKDMPLRKYIRELLRDTENGNDIEEYQFTELLCQNKLVIYFDGFDEVKAEHREKLLDEIREIVCSTKESSFFLTSRPDDAISSLSCFRYYNIAPLSPREAELLMERYDNQRVYPTDYEGDRMPRRIMEEIKDSDTIVWSFLEIPLLVSLLYLTYGLHYAIPQNSSIFYRNVYEALYRNHDIAIKDGYEHEKRSGLDIDQFERVLTGIGFLSVKYNLVEYSSKEIRRIITQSLQRFDMRNCSCDAYLQDLISIVPFLKKEGDNYRWIHRSFAEYFAAQYIDEDIDRTSLVKALTQGGGSLLVLQFFAEINPSVVKQVVLKPILAYLVDTVANERRLGNADDINFFYNEMFPFFRPREIILAIRSVLTRNAILPFRMRAAIERPKTDQDISESINHSLSLYAGFPIMKDIIDTCIIVNEKIARLRGNFSTCIFFNLEEVRQILQNIGNVDGDFSNLYPIGY